jgi:peroxiredoxin
MPDASREARDAFTPEGSDAGLTTDDAASASDAGSVLGSDAASGGLCPPAGPFGQRVGDVAPDVTLTDCDGNTRSLHALCDREAVWLFELALWCPPCRDFAMSGANRVYDRFRTEAGDSFEGWVVVSEDASFEPATSTTCREVRERYGLHAPVLFDTEGVLQSEFGVASNEVQIVLGPGARIAYVGHYGADEVEAEIARVLAE